MGWRGFYDPNPGAPAPTPVVEAVQQTPAPTPIRPAQDPSALAAALALLDEATRDKVVKAMSSGVGTVPGIPAYIPPADEIMGRISESYPMPGGALVTEGQVSTQVAGSAMPLPNRSNEAVMVKKVRSWFR